MNVERCEIGNETIELGCKLTPTAGTSDNLILLNWEKVNRSPQFSTLKPSTVIQQLTRKFGGEGLLIQGRENSIAPAHNAENGTFKPTITHTLTFRTFGVDPITLDVVNRLIFSKVIALWRSSNGWYFVSGFADGMVVSNITLDPNDEDTGGGMTIELSGSKENNLAYIFADTYAEVLNLNGSRTASYDEAATDEAFLALVNSKVTMAITGVTAGTVPVFTVASTAELKSGMSVQFENITWTTDPTSGDTLNGNSYVIEVIDGTTFRINSGNGDTPATFDTTGGVYGSGGTIQRDHNN